MAAFIEALISFFANLLSIIFSLLDPQKTTALFKNKKTRVVAITAAILILACGFAIARPHFSGQSSVIVTQVILSHDSLEMNIGDTRQLNANVLYSDNSADNQVVWLSSNPSVANITSDGLVTVLGEGTAIITAQATQNGHAEFARCSVSVKSPPSGYSISVQPSGLDSYFYIRIHPYDDNITAIRLYAKAPSGQIFHPSIDENDLYRFYSECGTWTVYASVESDNGMYEAHKPEDFATFEVTKVSSNPVDDILDNIISPQ